MSLGARMASMAYGGSSDGPHVSIDKAANGYLVTLSPDPSGGSFAAEELAYGGGAMGELSPAAMEKIREWSKKIKPKTFVFLDIEEAWGAVKEFLLDGRMPKSE